MQQTSNTANTTNTANIQKRVLNVQGSSMDKKVVKSNRRSTLSKWAMVVFLMLFGLWYGFGQVSQGRSLNVDQSRVVIAKAKIGMFEDYVPIRSKVVPLKTVFLDAVQGGRVEEVLIEDGETVEAGQALIRLSNSDLQLSVMSTESRVMEQLNAMRDQELRLEQNRLSHKRNLIELDYQIKTLERELKQHAVLFKQNHIAQVEYQEFIDKLAYYQERKNITIESQASDEKLMATQLTFFKEKAVSMEANLAFARKSLQDLIVRAPVAGRLSGFDMEIGQNVSRGERLGQISDPESFKLESFVDEYYLPRVTTELSASFQLNNTQYELVVSKVYPDVRNGQFKIDMKPTANLPSNLRRGQTLQSKLILGDENSALMIPNGPFVQDTGGKWIFVVDKNQQYAVKRAINTGRKNNRFVEVISGLSEGEQVVTSTYSNFKEMDTLQINTKS